VNILIIFTLIMLALDKVYTKVDKKECQSLICENLKEKRNLINK